jgi:hypothetical protein
MTTVDHEPAPGRHSASGTQPTAPAPGPADRRLLWICALVLAVIVGGALFLIMARGAINDVRHHGDPATSHHRHRVVGAAHGRDEATLDLVSGATTVTVRTGDTGTDMYRITTPDGGALLPAVVDHGDTVEVQLTDSGQHGASTVLVELSDKVAWHLRLGGGSNEATVDAHEGGLAGLDFATGVSTVTVSLPKPHGTVRVGIAGGAGSVTVHAPAGTPARLRVGGGAASASLDGEQHSGVSGGSVFTTSGYDSATDRYDVDATTGVSTIVVDHG